MLSYQPSAAPQLPLGVVCQPHGTCPRVPGALSATPLRRRSDPSWWHGLRGPIDGRGDRRTGEQRGGVDSTRLAASQQVPRDTQLQ